MTNQSTTTKEALEPCPLAHPIVNGVRFTNFSNNVKAHIWCYDCGLEFEGRVNEPRDKVAERWNSRVSAPIVAPEVDEMGSDTNFPLSETLRLLVEWAQHLHVSHECDCDGWEQRSFLIEAAQRYRREIAERAAPASTVAPQQSVPARCHCNVFCEFEDSPTKPENCVNVTASPVALRDEAEDFARRVVGTVFDNTAASHETLKQTMIERIADSVTPPSTLAKAVATAIKREADDMFAMPVPDEPIISEWAAIVERCLAGGE